jgi:hypothetical protein
MVEPSNHKALGSVPRPPPQEKKTHRLKDKTYDYFGRCGKGKLNILSG